MKEVWITVTWEHYSKMVTPLNSSLNYLKCRFGQSIKIMWYFILPCSFISYVVTRFNIHNHTGTHLEHNYKRYSDNSHHFYIHYMLLIMHSHTNTSNAASGAFQYSNFCLLYWCGVTFYLTYCSCISVDCSAKKEIIISYLASVITDTAILYIFSITW